MKCIKCGTELKNDQNFCPKCGCERVQNSELNLDVKRINANNKKKIIIIFIILSIIIASISIGWISSEVLKSKGEVKRDLSVTLSVLMMQSEEPYYIYSVDDEKIELINDEKLSENFYKKCTYEIKKVKIVKDEATVDLNFSSPDIYDFLETSIDHTKTYKHDELVSEIINGLNNNVKFKTYQIQVKLIKVNGNWYLKPNSQLSNALSGNLISWYSELGGNIVNSLLEE